MKKQPIEIDEELLKGIMVGDVPVLGRQPKAAVAAPIPEPASPHSADYSGRFLINTPCPTRVQCYINRELYRSIKRFLPVVAPEVSIASYVSNVLARHLADHREAINELYSRSTQKPL